VISSREDKHATSPPVPQHFVSLWFHLVSETRQILQVIATDSSKKFQLVSREIGASLRAEGFGKDFSSRYWT